jgi:AmpD protein
VAFPEFQRLTPNRASAPAHERQGVVFHHSVVGFKETIAHMLSPESRVSYHALIAADGTRCTLVADEDVAWHAGVSEFRGRPGCNAFLLGLAFAGDTYREPLTGSQIESALEWLAVRWAARGWTLEWMTDHRQVAPGRKDDLNPPEWDRLRAAIAARFAELRAPDSGPR